MQLPSLQDMARALNGEVSGKQVLAPGPGHSAKDRSLSVTVGSEDRDGFVVRSFAGDDWKLCRDHVRERLGLGEWQPSRGSQDDPFARLQARASRPRGEQGPTDDEQKRVDKAQRTWQRAVDPRGTIVETYLASRGLDLTQDVCGTVLRFHPNLPWKADEGTLTKHPAMLAAMTNIVTGELTAIHCTALTPDGQKIQRKMRGVAKGAAIRLHASDADLSGLVVGEGIESCMSARVLGLSPVWALGSTSFISDFDLVDGVDNLTLLEEFEESGAGVVAVAACADRWFTDGRTVEIASSAVGSDANDALKAWIEGGRSSDTEKFLRVRAFDPASFKPTVRVSNGNLATAVDEVEAVIIKLGLPIFVRGGELVHPIVEEVLAAHGRLTKVARLKEFSPIALADVLSRRIEFQRFDKRSEGWVTIDPPPKLMEAVLHRDGRWKLPSIVGAITTPTLRPDGTLLAKPGYDPVTRLYLTEGFKLPPIPASPTKADAERSLKLLVDVLAGFPFVDGTDRAVALSGIITAVIRGGMLVAPLHAIRAHSAGTGKSYFVDVACMIATGRLCPVIAAGKTEEETEKRLGSLLRSATPIISIDNVNGELGGDALCQMVERPLVRIRILGKSEVPEFECKATVFATGNNLVLVGDMTRRTILCNLDANMERPELRTFGFDPVQRILADRATYVAAALTIAMAYRAAGSPKVCETVGSYGDWSSMVRAPLIWLGEADPIKSMESAREEDPELLAVRTLHSQWREHLPLASRFTAAQLIEWANETNEEFPSTGELKRPELRDLLMQQAGDQRIISSRRLGKWLTRISGRVIDGHKLVVDTDVKHGNRFGIESQKKKIETRFPADDE